jgi:hypothetical protein
MALTWNVSQIIDYKELCWNPCDPPEIGDDGENRVMIDPITDGLIWATLMTGIGTITEKNYEEFWCRLEMNSLLNGPYMRWGEDAKWRGQSAPETKSGYSLEMVYRHGVTPSRCKLGGESQSEEATCGASVAEALVAAICRTPKALRGVGSRNQRVARSFTRRSQNHSVAAPAR